MNSFCPDCIEYVAKKSFYERVQGCITIYFMRVKCLCGFNIVFHFWKPFRENSDKLS